LSFLFAIFHWDFITFRFLLSFHYDYFLFDDYQYFFLFEIDWYFRHIDIISFLVEISYYIFLWYAFSFFFFSWLFSFSADAFADSSLSFDASCHCHSAFLSRFSIEIRAFHYAFITLSFDCHWAIVIEIGHFWDYFLLFEIAIAISSLDIYFHEIADIIAFHYFRHYMTVSRMISPFHFHRPLLAESHFPSLVFIAASLTFHYFETYWHSSYYISWVYISFELIAIHILEPDSLRFHTRDTLIAERDWAFISLAFLAAISCHFCHCHFRQSHTD